MTKKRCKWIIKYIGKILVVLFFLFLFYVMARLYLFASCVIPTDSMYPALLSGDYIIASLRIPGRRVWKEDIEGNITIRRKAGVRKVAKGDIIIFSFPYTSDNERMVLGNELFYCKRCVALPGEEYQWEWQRKKYCVHLPKAGEILALDSTNYMNYRKCIEYETRKKTYCRDNVILLEDSVIVNYRFSCDYYFMCGDNTGDSYDSRFWGLLPDDFILGVGRFIWFSKNPHTGEIRWNRISKKLL